MTANFKLQEFRSKCGADVPKDLIPNIEELARNLQVLRDEIGLPITITSGYRSPSHNRKVGGSPNSQHLQGRAADIQVNGMTPRHVKDTIERLIKEGKMRNGGIGLYATFVHYDTAKVRRW